jgi:hypothetical protein
MSSPFMETDEHTDLNSSLNSTHALPPLALERESRLYEYNFPVDEFSPIFLHNDLVMSERTA